jgi:hypothetical protein
VSVEPGVNVLDSPPQRSADLDGWRELTSMATVVDGFCREAEETTHVIEAEETIVVRRCRMSIAHDSSCGGESTLRGNFDAGMSNAGRGRSRLMQLRVIGGGQVYIQLRQEPRTPSGS